MKKYKIRFNDRVYDVEMEEVGGATSAPVAQSVTTTTAPSAATVPVTAVQAPSAAGSAGGHPVQAPMPGNILDVRVNVGDIVTEGQVIAILEAMKMENEICAPKAGRILGVGVGKGHTVNVGDLLVSIG